MKDVIVRVKITDLEALKNKLVLLGYFFSQPVIQHDRIFVPNGLLFLDIKQGTTVLRIRNTNGSLFLLLKRKGDTNLDTIEREIRIDDPDQAAEILKYLDYYQVLEFAKVRQKCSYNGLTICLDEVDELGSFVEIKKQTEYEDTTQIEEQLRGFLETMGVRREDEVQHSYELMVYYQQQQ